MHWFENAGQYEDRTAIVAAGQSYSYTELTKASRRIAQALLDGRPDLQEARIAYLVDPSFEYTAVQWGIWLAGGIAVPLCTSHPLPSVAYVLEDTGAKLVVVGGFYQSFLAPLALQMDIQLKTTKEIIEYFAPGVLPDIDNTRRAMILYTSGTTSKPKGVVTTHANIAFQIECLVKAWDWRQDDHILNVLPLHHVHGIINAMCCALWAGACCEFLPRFHADLVWEKFQQGKVNVFMAVPTIYHKLISYWQGCGVYRQEQLSAGCRSFRLMVSGSSALPVTVLEKWREITGHTLLERYGMTEIGMAISNPYMGERRPGHVGQPLPGVQIRLFADGVIQQPNQTGEVQVKGPNVFLEYWNNPEATQKSFTAEGWFLTGDIAELHDGYYKILGRDSVDILKSGGYKISALEIEDLLLQHPAIRECAVVGLPDEEWGEQVTAFLVLSHPLDAAKGAGIWEQELKPWLRERLPAYKVPKQSFFLEELPRNALGKVTKNELNKP